MIQVTIILNLCITGCFGALTHKPRCVFESSLKVKTVVQFNCQTNAIDRNHQPTSVAWLVENTKWAEPRIRIYDGTNLVSLYNAQYAVNAGSGISNYSLIVKAEADDEYRYVKFICADEAGLKGAQEACAYFQQMNDLVTENEDYSKQICCTQNYKGPSEPIITFKNESDGGKTVSNWFERKANKVGKVRDCIAVTRESTPHNYTCTATRCMEHVIVAAIHGIE